MLYYANPFTYTLPASYALGRFPCDRDALACDQTPSGSWWLVETTVLPSLLSFGLFAYTADFDPPPRMPGKARRSKSPFVLLQPQTMSLMVAVQSVSVGVFVCLSTSLATNGSKCISRDDYSLLTNAFKMSGLNFEFAVANKFDSWTNKRLSAKLLLQIQKQPNWPLLRLY